MKTDPINNKKSNALSNQKQNVPNENTTYGKYKLKSKTKSEKSGDLAKDRNKRSPTDLKSLARHRIGNIKNDAADREKKVNLAIDIDNINLVLKQLQDDLPQQEDINIYDFYRDATLNLKNNPVVIAYYFLKQGKKIPENYIKYILFPFLAIKYISDDQSQLENNINLIKSVTHDLDIKQYHNVSFENILQLKQNLQKKYGVKNQSQQNLIHKEQNKIKTSSKANGKQTTPIDIAPIVLDAPQNDVAIIDSDDIEHIQYLVENKTINKATKYDTINRIKRYFLHRKSATALSEISFVVGVLSFALFATGTPLIMGLVAIFALRFLLSAIFAIVTKIKQHKYQKFADANLAQGLEILKKEELSEGDLKLITELRKKQSYLFRTMHLDEIYHLYAEIEKMNAKLTILNKKTQKNLQDRIDIIELEFYIDQKEINIEKYMEISDNIFEFSNKELETNIKKWNTDFIPELNDAFNKKSKNEQNEIIEKVMKKKKVKQKVDCINLFTMEDNINIEDKISDITAKDTLKTIMATSLTIASSKMQGMTEALIREIFLSCLYRRTFISIISNVFESVRCSVLFYHSYYITLFFLLLNVARVKILDSIDKKRLKKIEEGEKAKTGFLFGLINSRDRTNREEISTLTAVQKNKTLDVLKLMEKHNSCMKKALKLIEKNKQPSLEKLLRIQIDFKYLTVQAACQMYSNTTDFLTILSDKMSDVSPNLADALVEDYF